MCFSATASFTVSALLVPVGIYGLNRAFQGERRYLALAAFPLLFGIQQAVEGALWLTLDATTEFNGEAAALGFLFFAYFLWPFFVPLAALEVEQDSQRRRWFVAFAFVGFLFGTSLYLPLLLIPEWMSVEVTQGAILYQPVLVYDTVLPRAVVRIFYAFVVSVPLLFSTVAPLRNFGLMILTSVIFSAVFFLYAFVSIWCFFAALLSVYVLRILPPRARTRMDSEPASEYFGQAIHKSSR